MEEQRYQFTRDCVHEGIPRKAGKVLKESEFPDGSLGPCRQTGIVVPYVEPKRDAPQGESKPEKRRTKKSAAADNQDEGQTDEPSAESAADQQPDAVASSEETPSESAVQAGEISQ